jgi:hypothetical protein
MLTSSHNIVTEQVMATDVRFADNFLYISLNDGREVSLPLERVKWLE